MFRKKNKFLSHKLLKKTKYLDGIKEIVKEIYIYAKSFYGKYFSKLKDIEEKSNTSLKN